MVKRRAEPLRIDWRQAVSAAVVLLLAAALRFYGLTWGLPDSQHEYSYHPDEFLLIGSALMVLQGAIPTFYNYPSLYMFLAAFAVLSGTAYGAVGSQGDIYLASRIITVLMSVGAVGATMWAGRVVFGWAAGLVAAVLLAIAPLHVQHSHFATVDVPCTLFVAAGLGFAGLILSRGTWRVYVLGGVMVGLAAGTKYNAGIVLLALIAAHYMRQTTSSPKARWDRLAAMLGAAAAAFVISTPGVIFKWSNFISGLTYELRHSGEGHGLVFAGTGSGFIYTFANSLWYGLGPLLAALLVVSIIYAVVRKDRGALMVLAFLVPYYLIISLSQVRFVRYTLPMYPAIAMLVGWMVTDYYGRLAHRRALIAKTAWAAVAVFVALVTLYTTLIVVRMFGDRDPRNLAAAWVNRHIEMGGAIGVIEVPWFYSPPLSKDLGFGSLPQRLEAARNAPYEFVIFSECDTSGCWWTLDTPPRWIITSNYETEDAERLANNESLSKDQRNQVDRVLTDLELIRRHYVVRASYDQSQRNFLKIFGMRLPHDMGYVSPTITIYELKQ